MVHRSKIKLLGAVLSAAFAALTPLLAGEAPVVLPRYVVTGEKDLPPPESWHHARAGDFEVLSSASERETRELVADLMQFSLALDVVCPGLRRETGVPVQLILCGRPGEFRLLASTPESDRAPIARLLSEGPWRMIVVDMARREWQLTAAPVAEAERSAAGDEDEPGSSEDGSEVELESSEVDHGRQLRRALVRLYLQRAEPRFPAWFEEGLAQLLMSMRVTPTVITFGRLEDPNKADADRFDGDFSVALRQRGFVGFDQFFGVDPTPAAMPPLDRALWVKQAQAFVHYCFYNRQRDLQQELLAFAEAGRREAPTRARFRAAFGCDYETLLDEVRLYAGYGRYRYFELRAERGKSLPPSPRLALTDAAQGDIGRIKSAALRLSGHPEEARVAAGIAWRRGERQPALLVEIGLDELAQRHNAQAREWLERAWSENVQDPRVGLALAKLRLASNARAPDGQQALSPGEAARVLQLLHAAANLAPAMAEPFAVGAKVWAEQTEEIPPREVRAIVRAMQTFPRDRELAYQGTRVLWRAGLTKEAQEAIQRALTRPVDAAERERWMELERRLQKQTREGN